MMLFIGLFLIIPVLLILVRLYSIKVKRIEEIILNGSLILLSISFIVLCFVVNKEPFAFEINNPIDYFVYAAVVFLFTPFLWIITCHFARQFFKKIKVNKKAKLKNKKDFIYYRDDLNKISPNVIMFTSAYDIDYQKSISATILKLKLTGFLKQTKTKFKCTDIDESMLPSSEKQVLNLVRNNEFNKFNYIKAIEEEAINNKYVSKNKGGIIGRIIKMALIIVFCVMCFKGSIYLDRFTFDNYRVYTDIRNGQKYFKLGLEEDVEKLSLEVENDEDYFQVRSKSYIFKDRTHYDEQYIKADKLQYSVVKKAVFLNAFVPVSILMCIILAIISLYLVIEQLVNINKNYTRTIKGKELLTKAYALKNFLEDFSIIDKRNNDELILWEYYLVYSVALGVNNKIENEIIEKYLQNS